MGQRGGVRIAYITESFLPDLNGMAHTAVRVAEHLTSQGHKPLVIAPEPANGMPRPDADLPFPVVRIPSVGLPLYGGFRVSLPGTRLRAAVAAHRADLVHLAGPVVTGWSGGAAARKLDLPSLAVYATDMAAYARAYHIGRAGEAFAWRHLRRIHNATDRTLAPSSASATELRSHGFERISVWGRGVDTARFDPAKRSAALRAQLAPGGEIIVGYVGRVAAEKRVPLLAGITRLPGVKLVIVGGGPEEQTARRALPGAVFLGPRSGNDLATIYASFDVFAHAGPHETFGNTLQEAAASGLPVVAPATGGPLDIVEDGVTGYLVPPGDETTIAAAVARLVTDRELREAQADAARRLMLRRTWAAKCDELIGHYESLLARRGGTIESEARAAA